VRSLSFSRLQLGSQHSQCFLHVVSHLCQATSFSIETVDCWRWAKTEQSRFFCVIFASVCVTSCDCAIACTIGLSFGIQPFLTHRRTLENLKFKVCSEKVETCVCTCSAFRTDNCNIDPTSWCLVSSPAGWHEMLKSGRTPLKCQHLLGEVLCTLTRCVAWPWQWVQPSWTMLRRFCSNNVACLCWPCFVRDLEVRDVLFLRSLTQTLPVNLSFGNHMPSLVICSQLDVCLSSIVDPLTVESDMVVICFFCSVFFANRHVHLCVSQKHGFRHGMVVVSDSCRAPCCQSCCSHLISSVQW